MALDLDLLLDRRRVPEGFPAALAQTVDTSDPLGTYSYKLDPDYWFWLEAIVAKWTAPTVYSVPSVQIFRDGGNVGYFQNQVDFRLVTSPGEAPAGVAQVGRLVGLGMYFQPGAALRLRFLGFVPGNPSSIAVAALGRYVLRPDDAE